MNATATPSTTLGTAAAVVAPIERTAGRREGESRKNAALELLRARRDVFVRRGQRALLAALLEGAPTATADEVRAAVALPTDLDARLLGAVPGSLARAGIVRADGFVKSNRPERHASYLQRWRLLDGKAARDWLERNPDLPDIDAEPLDNLPLFAAAAQQKRPTVAAAGRSNSNPSTTKGTNNGSAE